MFDWKLVALAHRGLDNATVQAVVSGLPRCSGFSVPFQFGFSGPQAAVK